MRQASSRTPKYNQPVDAFTTHTGKIAVVPDDNIDTDRIIPARFLTRISRFGYGELLFKDVRGPEFELDRPTAEGASILVTGTNFGCGSSREHAVWAIQQAGFRAVISKKTDTSPGYSDIFRQNAANCGLLLIELNENDHAKLVEAGSGAEATIDLPNQTVIVNGQSLPFEINAATKDALVRGLDLIGTTLLYDTDITDYERGHESFTPASGAR
jgi:3-isopropylmalate/(R)-2-methylmalate dehydratase small subunit